MKRVENPHPPLRKNLAVVGGIMTLEPQYRRILEENDFLPKICNQDVAGLWGKVEGADFIILFAGTVSHRMAIKARKAAATYGIPLVTVTRSSISALKKSITDLRIRSASEGNGEHRVPNPLRKDGIHANAHRGR
jgi:hypothetical protein